jgi:hypothetical protein
VISLEELDVATEVTVEDVEEASVIEEYDDVSVDDGEDEVEVETWAVVLDVADPGTVVASEEMEEVWVDVVVDAEVAVLWVPTSKKAEPRMAMIKIARTAPTAAALLISSVGFGQVGSIEPGVNQLLSKIIRL